MGYLAFQTTLAADNKLEGSHGTNAANLFDARFITNSVGADILHCMDCSEKENSQERYRSQEVRKKPYTIAQVFGIIGILFFILPVFRAVGIMLQKGLYFLAILFSGWIALPKTISIIIKTTFFVSTFFLFSGVYLVCEMIWPKRYTDEIDRTGMGTGTPYHFRLQHSDTKKLFIRRRLI
jgi:hypothetical protein